MKMLQPGIDAFGRNDYYSAYSMLLPMAEQGYAEAQCIIGDIYWLGLGRDKDFQEAMRWLHKAAEQGHANACNTLGCIYTTGGPDLDPDEETAKKWYRRAIENGFDMYTQEWIDALFK